MQESDLIFFYKDYCEYCEEAFRKFYVFCKKEKLNFVVVFLVLHDGKYCMEKDGELIETNIPAVPALLSSKSDYLYVGADLVENFKEEYNLIWKVSNHLE